MPSPPPPTTTPHPEVEGLRTGARVARWVLLLGPLPAAALGLWIGLRGDDGVFAAIGLFQLWFALAVLLVMRGQARRIRAAAAGEAEAGPGRRLERLLAILAGSIGVLALAWTPVLELLRTHASWLASALTRWPLLQPGGTPTISAPAAWFAAAVLGLGAATQALLATYLGPLRSSVLPEAPALGRWARGGVWLGVLGTVGGGLHALSIELPHDAVVAVLKVVLAVLGAEMLLRGLRGPAPEPDGSPSTLHADPFLQSLLLRLLASRFNPSASVFGLLAEGLGIDLKSAWALRYVRRALAPLALGLLFLGWLSTCLVSVDTHERGVHERLGRLHSSQALGPGLHLVLPWPLDRVHRVSVDRVRETTIGYRGERNASLLWTSTHEQEHKLLVGDGRDMVSINAVLHYRAADPIAFLYTSEFPERELEAIANRVLMRRTIERSLDELLGENLHAFAAAVETEIGAEARRRGLGLEVVDFSLNGLHPPVDVAEDYQAIVSARIDRTTRILEAEQYRVEQLPEAEGTAFETERRARADAIRRTATATGGALAFTAVLHAALAAPGLYQFRRRLEVLEEALEGRSYHVIDHRILRDGGTLWLLD